MSDPTPGPRRLARTEIYRSSWVNLFVDRVEFPGGRIIEQHHLLDMPREATAVLVENAVGDLLFVHAYRYVLNTVQWEIPAGSFEKGETPLECARREVLEETGYETRDHRLVYTFYPINGISNQVFHVVHCKAGETSGDFDKNEVSEFRWFSPEEIRAMIKEKSLRDGYSLTALLLHLGGFLS